MLLVVREHTSPSAMYGAVLTLCSRAAVAAAFCAETARAQQLAGEVGGAKQAERVSVRAFCCFKRYLCYIILYIILCYISYIIYHILY
jgi:hypothetical protein